jgi:hypothetical protein
MAGHQWENVLSQGRQARVEGQEMPSRTPDSVAILANSISARHHSVR